MWLDRRQQAPFTFDDIYAAADRGCLVELFLKIDDRGIIELWAQRPESRAEIETALGQAVRALRERELRAAGVGDNALCLVVAIALEAIQQNWH
jgi:hypothetical protein